MNLLLFHVPPSEADDSVDARSKMLRVCEPALYLGDPRYCSHLGDFFVYEGFRSDEEAWQNTWSALVDLPKPLTVFSCRGFVSSRTLSGIPKII